MSYYFIRNAKQTLVALAEKKLAKKQLNWSY